ncbi:TonB-dependent receptor [Zhouia sp. PK063]|uniref:TonB-dependent receptor n=1 Tax=Zhouia sp. PK063 TaxID=3373602 RepID=UPI0037BA3C47
MKVIYNWLFTAVFALMASVAFSQSTVTGTVIDGDINQPLPGASVLVKGTTDGVSTDFDGKFSVNTTKTSGTLVISYMGYISQEIAFTGTSNVGKIVLKPSSVGLDEVQVIASVAVDRKTPVAVSTVKAQDIQLKLGTQEFPEVLRSTPGIYATAQGGGYGDGRVNIRGFGSENVAVMINGIPVNDMENGAVYWSNWAGLGDVTSSMQVQRGLGASKVAVPSIGGTINIVTKTTDVEEGGTISTSIANNGYLKYGMTYSTGLSKNGFAATVSASKISGDGYVDGTQFSGYNYFINLSKQFTPNHKLSFTAFGAQQEHGQHYNRSTIAEYKQTEAGPNRFNPDWGYLNGSEYNISYNYYHKPQMSLNDFWQMSDNTSLSTAVYASFGSGGGRRTRGDKLGSDAYRLGSSDQPIDFDQIVQENKDRGALGSSDIIYNSVNKHQWYGVLSTLKTTIQDKLTITGGVDGRYYIGSHYYQVDNLLGGDFYLNTTSSDNNYNQPLRVGDIFGKNYDGKVLRGGLFAQAEYEVNDSFNLFVASDVSNTTYSTVDFIKYASTDPDRKSKKVDFLGYGIKGGGNYNLDDHNNVFVNVGYFSKAPFLTNVFQSSSSTNANPDAINEKVFSAEIGYGFRSSKFSGNLNVYRTAWLDKSISGSIQRGSGNEPLYYNLTGMDAVHQGIELDFIYRVTDKFKLKGMASLGDYQWKSNVSADVYDDITDNTTTIDLYAKNLKVGNSAQTTFSVGGSYDYAPKSTIFIDYNYAGDMYADFYVTSRSKADAGQAWKAPNYALVDLGIKHSFKIGTFDAALFGRINNALNTEYISDANDVDGTAQSALVYYGLGRRYSVGLNVKF